MVLAETHKNKLDQVDLFNEYGPTEATVWSSAAQIYCRVSRNLSIMKIGKLYSILYFIF